METISRFRNYGDVAFTPGRKIALDIAAAGLAALDPELLLPRALRFDSGHPSLEAGGRFLDLSRGRLFVIGGGKAADVMAAAVENLIGPENIAAGIVVCKERSVRTRKIQVREAGHPVPDARGVEAMREIGALKGAYAIGNEDVVLCLLSGGASALMPAPAPGITLADKQAVTRLLLAAGADITEANLVRKRLSASKGGRLGLHFAPATVVSLIVSDVIGDDPGTIGSGPTFPEKSRPGDAAEVLLRRGLWNQVPAAVRRRLEADDSGDARSLPNCVNQVIGNSRVALEAMADRARRLGKSPRILTDAVQGDPEQAARAIAGRILEGAYGGHDVLLAAGETTPALPRHPGRGGRNQHFAAATLEALKDLGGAWAHLSLGSDGSDYLPETAGALVDRGVLERGAILGLDLRDYLERFDTHAFFARAGHCLVETGPTGTNAGDWMIYVLSRR